MTSDGQNCYTYNDANQLSQVKNCATNQIVAQYGYDYQGNRIEKKIYNGGSLQKTVYSPDKTFETVKQASNGATANTSYYYVNNELTARKNPDGSKNYYLNDNLGSVSVLTNQSGTVVENSTYYPFGQIRTGGTQSKYAYTGQENDQETNLDYYNARYYDPSNMHFTQPDSELPNVYDPQQLNRYAYVRNNPMTVTDPTGHYDVYNLIPEDFMAALSDVVNIIESPSDPSTPYYMTALPLDILSTVVEGFPDQAGEPFRLLAEGYSSTGGARIPYPNVSSNNGADVSANNTSVRKVDTQSEDQKEQETEQEAYFKALYDTSPEGRAALEAIEVFPGNPDLQKQNVDWQLQNQKLVQQSGTTNYIPETNISNLINPTLSGMNINYLTNMTRSSQ